AAYVAEAGLPNLRPPVALDAADASWPVSAAQAMVCINMIHISPWAATAGLFPGAARTLGSRGLLVTYGPYIISGDLQAESNAAFDQSLRARNPAWGLRELDDIVSLARTHGLALAERSAMPANNHPLVFKKT